MEHAGGPTVTPFSAWRRRVRLLVEAEVDPAIQHFVLDDVGLAVDHASGISVEEAAAVRISDAASLG